MKKLYLLSYLLIGCLITTVSSKVLGQTCIGVSATYGITESRCAATGEINVTVTGGSGLFNYRVVGPVTTPFSSSNIISGLPPGVYEVIVTDVIDGCTMPSDFVTVPGSYNNPSFLLTTTDVTCGGANDGTITVNSLLNGRAPFVYTIVAPSAAGVGTTSSTGNFTGLPAGDYLIQLTDSCGGIQTRGATIKNSSWFFTASSIVRISCDSGTANIDLEDIAGNNNHSGTRFNGFMYGVSFILGDTIWSTSPTFNVLLGPNKIAVIIAKDGCGVIKVQPWKITSVPKIKGKTIISNKACNSFTAALTNLQNFTNPIFSLYDNTNTLLATNATGIFNVLPYGSYCIEVRDNCYDTTVVDCFTVAKPIPSVTDSIVVSNANCFSFDAVITGQKNLFNPKYCLYNSSNVLITCNTTGNFSNLPYGNYCIKITDSLCYDTTITRCITLSKIGYDVTAPVLISNRTCTGFNATIQGQSNFSNATYFLYNSSNTLISTNTTGIFTNLAYGDYCIDVQITVGGGNCYDTTIRRCITVLTTVVDISATIAPSCTLGKTKIGIKFTSGIAPFRVEVYDHLNNLVFSQLLATNYIDVDNLNPIPYGQQFRVVGYDSCNNFVEQYLTCLASKVGAFQTLISFKGKCPGGMHPNGSSDVYINTTSTSNITSAKIIAQNGSPLNILAQSLNGYQFEFYDLEPATYIIAYTFEGCSNKYDTIVVKPYVYPDLSHSSSYQCDNTDFSVGAVVTGGLAPFNYQIIGSTPSIPSVNTPIQSNPVFTFNTGTNYTVVRLRSVDGCGNAALSDVGLVPLANVIITLASDCFSNSTLSVDSFPNATYTWYKRTTATDSVMIGSTTKYALANLAPADTGRYVCKISINNGCLIRLPNITLVGYCVVLADQKIVLSGQYNRQQAQLQWRMNDEAGVKTFVVEKKDNKNNTYTSIGSLASAQKKGVYVFADNATTPSSASQYRIKGITTTNTLIFSNTITLKTNTNSSSTINVFPNPVVSSVTISFGSSGVHSYCIKLLDVTGKLVVNKILLNTTSQNYIYQRTSSVKAGTYILQVIDLNTQAINSQLVVFK
jgi:hypothetical protein